MIETDIRFLLVNNDTLLPLLGDRVYFGAKPQNQRLACVVISRTASTRELVFRGPSGYSSGTLQLDCFGPAYPDTKQLADVIRKVLDGFSGKATESSQGAIGFLSCTDDRDMPIVPAEGASGPTVFGVSIDVNYSVEE